MRLQGAGAGIAESRRKPAGLHADDRLPDRAAVVRALRAWYARAGRDLPWRRARDPYRIWISEVMLQQTQVERVRDYFTRFIARLPTVTALAEAGEPEVLRLWEGLGYYRRARQLHAAARLILTDHAGRFPRTAAGLRTLPGIGRYTAGAIASIAFDEPEPIVEANSRRVIARLIGHAAPLGGTAGDEPIWRAAAALVPRTRPGRFNQALMDLGALVCTPDRPLCGGCPLAGLCTARREGTVAKIPAPAPRRAVENLRETALVVRRGGRLLVVRRGADEWWSGLWDFPRVSGAAGRASRGIAASPLLAPLGCGPTARLGAITHTVTHHRIAVDVVSCSAARSGRPAANRRWLTPAQLARLAMPAPGRRIARLAAEHARAVPKSG
ncbi:MAG: A/G-specific adenine glycosylase [Planctomycetia bacterium]|jgi:A/G-specific adenine glycosylase